MQGLVRMASFQFLWFEPPRRIGRTASLPLFPLPIAWGMTDPSCPKDCRGLGVHAFIHESMLASVQARAVCG